MSTNTNVSSVISPDVLKNISSSTAIKTFGDQAVNKAKQVVLAVAIGKLAQLEKDLTNIIATESQLKLDHPNELKRLEILHKNKEITDEQYNAAVAAENKAYDLQVKILDDQITKLKKDIANIIADPYRKAKDAALRLKTNIKSLKTNLKKKRTLAKRGKIKKVLKNAAKTLAPIVALQLSNQFASVLSQRSKLEDLVNQVNDYIDQANTPETIQIAINLRNNTIALINNSIKKLQNIEKVIQQLDLYITIFTIIVAILSAIPIPTSIPPGIGIPVSLITRIIKQLEKASALIVSLNVITAIATLILENEIANLEELISRLHDVNQLLDDKTNLLDNQELTSLKDSLSLGDFNNVPEYKGFKFEIKEEQTLGAHQAVTVKGIKRHYAVAINRDGVSVLRSEYSFTQDPQTLVEQLKLIIDQKNLQG
jgi:hypothetical protein